MEDKTTLAAPFTEIADHTHECPLDDLFAGKHLVSRGMWPCQENKLL